MKVFGSGTRTLMRDEFTLKYQDVDENEKQETFKVVPRASAGDIAGIMHAAQHAPQKAIGGLITLLTKVMDNKDGLVGAKWEPTPLERKDGDDREPSFRGPDGEIYALDDETALAEFDDPSNWTSRRRWVKLIDENDEAVVEMDDLQDITEWVIGLATDRPTRPRA